MRGLGPLLTPESGMSKGGLGTFHSRTIPLLRRDFLATFSFTAPYMFYSNWGLRQILESRPALPMPVAYISTYKHANNFNHASYRQSYNYARTVHAYEISYYNVKQTCLLTSSHCLIASHLPKQKLNYYGRATVTEWVTLSEDLLPEHYEKPFNIQSTVCLAYIASAYISTNSAILAK